MAVRPTWTKAARDDLLDIYDAIALDQPATAERTFDRIEAKIDLLGTQPRMGARRRGIRQALRMLVEPPYPILYCTAPDTDEGPLQGVEIVRVVDGRRSLAALF